MPAFIEIFCMDLTEFSMAIAYEYELCRDDRITTCETFSAKAISSIGSGELIADRDNRTGTKKPAHTKKVQPLEKE